MFIPHAYYYSIEGRRKDERPPDVGPHSIWWRYYEKWATYMKRLSFMMTDCKVYASTAVLCRNRDLKHEEVRPLFEIRLDFSTFQRVCGKTAGWMKMDFAVKNVIIRQ